MNLSEHQYSLIFNDLMESEKGYLVAIVIRTMSDEEKEHYINCLQEDET